VIAPAFLYALRIIIARLGEPSIDWALTGSLAFALQGVPVEPHDIDLQTDEAGAYAIERQLAAFCIRAVTFSAAEHIRSHFGALLIEGIKVEIMGALQKRLPDGSWEAPVDVRRYRHYVEVEGLRVPVLALEYEYQAYLTMGRHERAALLKQAIEESKSRQ
jgi:hypothetical protein